MFTKGVSSPVFETPIWGFPKIRGTILGVPIIRSIIYWGLYWGSLYFGKLPYLGILQQVLGESGSLPTRLWCLHEQPGMKSGGAGPRPRRRLLLSLLVLLLENLQLFLLLFLLG